MSIAREPFHPVTISEESGAGHVFTGTDPEARGITQRLWIGTKLMGSILGKVDRSDLPYVIERAADWAAAADVFAAALLEQQAQPLGTLSVQLLQQAMSIVEERRRRLADNQAERERLQAEREQGEVQP